MTTFFGIALAALFALSACQGDKPQENKTEKSEEKTEMPNLLTLTKAQAGQVQLAFGSLEARDLSSTLKAKGRVDVPPQNLISISAPMGGYLKSTTLLAGMAVRKGEVIAVMEDQQYIQLQQDYLMIKNKIIFADQELKRQQELNASKASSDKALQQAQAEVSTLKIQLSATAERLRLLGLNPDALTEQNLSRTLNILSPVNGFVAKVNANVGRYLNPADVMFQLVDPSDIHLVLSVFEQDVNHLAVGQRLEAYTNDNPQQRYAGEIILIGKDFAADRSVEVQCHFEKYDKRLIPGTFMNAEIALKRSNTLALPTEAIVAFEGKHYVFVVKDSLAFEPRAVDLGLADGNYTAVSPKDAEALKGQRLVTKGSYTLLMAWKNKAED
jgi:cobalt-zinc-cadmium efflux system membrane fusion protein